MILWRGTAVHYLSYYSPACKIQYNLCKLSQVTVQLIIFDALRPGGLWLFMQKKRWLLAIPLLLLAGLAALLWRQDSVAFDPAAAFSGQAQITGPISVDLTVFPPIATAGDSLSLDLRLNAPTAVSDPPAISIELPAGLQVDPRDLPAGVTINLQTNSLTWLPSAAAGGEAAVSVPARVETVDLQKSAQVVDIVLRQGEVEQRASAPIWIGIEPQVTGILAPPQVAVKQPFPLKVELAGSGPFELVWLPGDGRRIAVNEPELAFPAPGIYEITVEARNPLGRATRAQTITVAPHPAAQFTVDDPMPGVGQPVAFTSRSGGQDPLDYTWDFGDGVMANAANPTHQYAAPGSYQVHLTVENVYGRSEAFWTVLVGLPPEAQMTIADSVSMGQPIAGLAQGDVTVLAYRWDMGDGRSLDGAEISYIYRQTGDFYVSVTAVNEFGSAELGQWVRVDPGVLATYLPLILNGGMNGETAVSDENPFEIALDPVDLDEPFVMMPISIPDGTSQAEELFIYINEARRQFDLPPLAYVYELSAAAQQHTDDMAQFQYTGHTGADGSYPLERLIRNGYAAGYAGEATAWGFENAYEAVEFWVNSPPHRRIILNRYATDVGVAFTVDFNAPNVWYWTAEFGNQFAAGAAPFIRLQEPEAGLESLNSIPLQFSWNYPMPLAEGQRFMIYWRSDGRTQAVGTVSQPALRSQYLLDAPDLYGLLKSGDFMWQVVLEDEAGNALVVSEERPLLILHDDAIPTPTPTPTPLIPVTPSPTPLPTLMPTAVPPTETPMPPTAVPPPVVTATPNP